MLNTLSLAVVALTGFLLSIVIIAMAKRFAARLRLVDRVSDDGLKIHKKATPFVGGFGIAIGTTICLFLSAGSLGSPIVSLSVPILLALCMFTLGLCDDLFRLPPLFRLGLELLAAAGLAYIIVLGGDSPFLSNLSTIGASVLFLCITFYAPSVINAVNMFDGMDGLAGGVSFVSAAGCMIVGYAQGNSFLTVVSAALAATLVGFLVFNFHPATVFMGDNGSYFLGFLLAMLTVLVSLQFFDSWFDLTGSLLLIGLPIVDASQVIIRRVLRGVSPFLGDRNHVYDVLHSHGVSFRMVALTCYAIQFLLVGSGVAILLRRSIPAIS